MSPGTVAVGEPTRGGRPRSGAVDRAILGTAMRLLREHGYQAMSIERVAAEAGVGKPAIYRRYPSKADLVVAALLALTPGEPPSLPADPRLALRELMRVTAEALAVPGSMTAIGSLLAERGREPELVRTARERLFEPQQARVRGLLERAALVGTLRPDVAHQPVTDMLFGAMLARTGLGEPADAGWIDGVVDAVWLGLARRTEVPDA